MEKMADQYQSSNKAGSMGIRRCAYACHADKLHPSFAPDIDTNHVCSGLRFRFFDGVSKIYNYKFFNCMKTTCFSTMLLAGVLAAGMSMTSCSNEDEVINSVDTRAARSVVVISAGEIPADKLHWTAGNEYHLDGKVAVPVGQTLTIDAGTKVVGLTKSDAVNASALIVPRGAKIEATGTASNPIVMTAENGQEGGWGGIVLLGNAPINQSGDVYIEGIDEDYLPSSLQHVDFRYGGNNPSDNSGILQYVRVEFAGASVSPDNELNAFTFGGVGSGTTVDHCQAYRGADDGFEFFGGCVNAKYLVSTATDDDAFDFDYGYTGKIQFAVATIDALLTYSGDPNGIECDNDGSSSSNQPFTHPVLSNLTIVGTSTGSAANALKSAANFRRNCQFTLANSILYGYPTGLLCETNNASNSIFTHNVISVSNGGTAISDDGFDGTENSIVTPDGIVLGSPWGNYKLAASLRPTDDPAKTGADFSALDGWFTTTTYKGAVAPTGVNWLTQNWIK